MPSRAATKWTPANSGGSANRGRISSGALFYNRRHVTPRGCCCSGKQDHQFLNKISTIYIYIYIYIERERDLVHSISFQTILVQEFEIVVDSWKFSMLLLSIVWDVWPIFKISSSKEQLQKQLEYTLLKANCHSWWISKMQSKHEDTLEKRYAIKVCFKPGKKCHRNVWNASDCFWTILHESSISFWVA